MYEHRVLLWRYNDYNLLLRSYWRYCVLWSFEHFKFWYSSVPRCNVNSSCRDVHVKSWTETHYSYCYGVVYDMCTYLTTSLINDDHGRRRWGQNTSHHRIRSAVYSDKDYLSLVGEKDVLCSFFNNRTQQMNGRRSTFIETVVQVSGFLT